MHKGVWDDSNSDLSRYRLSDMELLQKRASVVSKNKEAARVEWAQRQALLKQGIVPKEMQELIKKPKPAPVKKECKSTLKRGGSGRPSSAAGSVAGCGGKTQQARFSGLRTTAGVDPQAVTLKPDGTVTGPEAKDDTFESLKRLVEAMSQLERAMVSAIQDPGQTKGESYGQKYSPDVPIKYSPETLTSYYPEKSPKYSSDQPLSYNVEKGTTDAYLGLPQKYSPEQPQKYYSDSPQDHYYPEKRQAFPLTNKPLPASVSVPESYFPDNPVLSYPSTYHPRPDDEDEVSESSVFSLSPDHSQDTFNPARYRDDSDEDVISVPPAWQDYEQVRPVTVQPQSVPCYEPKISEGAGVDQYKENLEEPNICSVETADYLALMLEQTRKDLELMKIPDQCVQGGEEEEEFPQLPPVQSFGRNYEGDLMPRPYILRPVAKELYNPVVRSAGQMSNSLSLGSSLGPAPQKYPLRPSPS